MKEQHITRLKIPTHDVVLVTTDVNVRYVFESWLRPDFHGAPAWTIAHCFKPVRPLVRSTNIFHSTGRARYRVEWHPDGTDLLSSNRPKGQVVVPRCRYRGTWFLNKQLVVEKTHCLCAKELID